MRPSFRRTLAATTIAAGALVFAPALHLVSTLAAASADAPAQLAGTWILNKDLGSDPLGELDTSRPRRRSRAGAARRTAPIRRSSPK